VKFPLSADKDVTDGFSNKEAMKSLEVEYDAGFNLRNQCPNNLVRTDKINLANEKFVLKSMFANRGSLSNHLKLLGKLLTAQEAAPLVMQILNGGKCMHTNKYAHLDLYPDNVLVFEKDGKFEAKLADFGLTKPLTDDPKKKPGMPCHGNLLFKGYECTDYHNSKFDRKQLDQFSIGLLTYFIMTGKFFMSAQTVPATATTKASLLFEICPNSKDEYTLLDIKAKDFIGRLAFKDPADRMTLDVALEHPFIKNPEADAKTSEDLLIKFAADPKHAYPAGVPAQPWKGDLAWFTSGIQTYSIATQSNYCYFDLGVAGRSGASSTSSGLKGGSGVTKEYYVYSTYAIDWDSMSNKGSNPAFIY